MRQQQSVLHVVKDGITIDFQRFVQKTPRGVVNQYTSLVRDGHKWDSWFFADYREADKIILMLTPPGYDAGPVLASWTPEEFKKAIGA